MREHTYDGQTAATLARHAARVVGSGLRTSQEQAWRKNIERYSLAKEPTRTQCRRVHYQGDYTGITNNELI